MTNAGRGRVLRDACPPSTGFDYGTVAVVMTSDLWVAYGLPCLLQNGMPRIDRAADSGIAEHLHRLWHCSWTSGPDQGELIDYATLVQR